MAILLIKKGDKGENVKALQKALGITADGDFGSKTEEAVKAFQKANGLTVDGLVGNATQKALGLKIKDSSVEDLQCEITLSPITRHITKYNRTIKYIVVHYTAGGSSANGKAMAARNQFQNSDRDASADFCVDDEMIVQVNPSLTNYYCWAVGDGKGKYGVTNTNSISIEMCSNLKNGYSAKYPSHQGWHFTDATVNNTLKLVKFLMAKYNIPSDRVIRHYDASRKQCMGVVGWLPVSILDDKTGKAIGKGNESKWFEFKDRLK